MSAATTPVGRPPATRAIAFIALIGSWVLVAGVLFVWMADIGLGDSPMPHPPHLVDDPGMR